jgi:hypothetical protein
MYARYTYRCQPISFMGGGQMGLGGWQEEELQQQQPLPYADNQQLYQQPFIHAGQQQR